MGWGSLFNRLRGKIALLFGTMFSVVLVFQQCSDVQLSRVLFASDFDSRGFPFRLYPPTDYLSNQRYILLVDMTNSMISGACPFDVGNRPTWSTDSTYREHDPNKDTGADMNDGRAAGRDCFVDPALDIASKEQWKPGPYSPSLQYKTHLGNDYRGYRFDLVADWLEKMRQGMSQESIEKLRIMIIPISGGRRQAIIDRSAPLDREFVRLDDDRVVQMLDYLKTEHARNLNLVTDEADQTRWQKTNFGTTAPGEVLESLHPILDSDMKELNETGELNFATYDIIYLGDGGMKPLKSHLDETLDINRFCSGSLTSGHCQEVTRILKDEWGDPDLNSVEALDLRLSMLQTLPQYYGSGLVNVSFVRMFPLETVPDSPDETVLDLIAEAAKLRYSTIEKWNVPYGGTALNLIPVDGNVKTFKMTHLYVYNPNARIDKNGKLSADSDGDGLFDDQEIELGLDPTVQRSNGYCLDGFMVQHSFKDRCAAFAQGHSCDPALDTDIDGLNQCEEVILGTDPYDFDTDGDTIPDSLEWLYGFNPLQSEKDIDTSGDGTPNLVNFSAGLSPKHYFDSVADNEKSRYSVDFIGYEEIEDISLKKAKIELFDVRIKSIPVQPLKVVPDSHRIETYMGKVNGDGSNRDLLRIPKNFDLISYSSEIQMNKVVALARIVDPRFPKLVYWRIMKFSVSEGYHWTEKSVDLSSFRLLPMIDKNLSGGSQ